MKHTNTPWVLTKSILVCYLLYDKKYGRIEDIVRGWDDGFFFIKGGYPLFSRLGFF